MQDVTNWSLCTHGYMLFGVMSTLVGYKHDLSLLYRDRYAFLLFLNFIHIWVRDWLVVNCLYSSYITFYSVTFQVCHQTELLKPLQQCCNYLLFAWWHNDWGSSIQSQCRHLEDKTVCYNHRSVVTTSSSLQMCAIILGLLMSTAYLISNRDWILNKPIS